MRAPLLALAAVALLVPAAPAAACSPVVGYRVPTNLELTERADLILLGIAEGEVVGEDQYGHDEVIIRPVQMLKGETLPAEVRIRGSLSTEAGWVTPSDPRELYAPNPGALTGACARDVFQRGMMLLLFLQRDDEGRLHLASYPFARSAEDVPSPDAPWVKAVRIYAEIAALPAAERRPALIARRDALRSATGDPDAALLADDIDRQLRRRRIPPSD